MDLFSAKKLRQHGLCDDRWTVKDKLVQYKGLIKLYQRDNKLLTSNSDHLIVTQQKEISSLSNMIKTAKCELKNILKANRLKLDHILIPYKDIRLICRNLSAEEMMEQIKQIVYVERRRLDLLRYNKNKKTQELTTLKLQRGELEDQVKYKFESKFTTNTSKECEKITGRIQDAKLLFEAAISVSNFYKVIRDLLVKDSIFYTRLLMSLYGDRLKQNRCMAEAVLLGQIAVENLDDTRIDFKLIHAAASKAHYKRNDDLREAQLLLKQLPVNVKSLIRRDKEKDLFVIKDNDEDLRIVQANLEEDLNVLKMEIMVSQFEDILPRLMAQESLDCKLNRMWTTLKQNETDLKHRVGQAKAALDVVSYSDNKLIESFLYRKRVLKQDIEEKKLSADSFKTKRSFYTKLLADMRVSIRNIKEFCDAIKDSNKVQPSYNTHDEIKGDLFYIKYKIKCMMTSSKYEEAVHTELANKGDEFQEFARMSFQLDITEPTIRDEDEITFDNTIPTYFDIKEQSRHIVEVYKSTHF